MVDLASKPAAIPSDEDADVIVVGAGPEPSTAATYMARSGPAVEYAISDYSMAMRDVLGSYYR
jgi:ribulose 1,5-bisphosphate synthetase/thiazole synthase